MQRLLNGLAFALRGWAVIFLAFAIFFGTALGWGIWAEWGLELYGLIIGLLWSLVLLCLVWWFQPPAPRAHLLTTFMGRLRAKIHAILDVLKFWVFLAIVLGVIGLTVRFGYLWWQQIPF
jgi:hypothetical protein